MALSVNLSNTGDPALRWSKAGFGSGCLTVTGACNEAQPVALMASESRDCSGPIGQPGHEDLPALHEAS